MADPPAGPTCLSLPTELRLHIAASALEPHPLAGLENIHSSSGDGSRFELDTDYRPSASLSIRLVCRQFNIDFTRLAVRKTRFVLQGNAASIVGTQPEALLRDVKRLVVQCGHDTIAGWVTFPFNRECLQLDELDMVMPLAQVAECTALVQMFRRLRNVRKIGFPLCDDVQLAKLRGYRLIGAMLKEDHYQRYDAPNAPNLESTWWSWSFNREFSWATFVAEETKPIMAEQEYMMVIKPKIDEVMEQTASALS